MRIWIYLFLLFILLAYIDIRLKEESYEWITCGEALFRATGSAAPRNKIEEQMYDECLFLNIKKWN